MDHERKIRPLSKEEYVYVCIYFIEVFGRTIPANFLVDFFVCLPCGQGFNKKLPIACLGKDEYMYNMYGLTLKDVLPPEKFKALLNKEEDKYKDEKKKNL